MMSLCDIMRMRKISEDKTGSIYPIIVVIIVIAVAGFLVLIYGEVLEPFFNFGGGSDDTVAPEISYPRLVTHQILQIIWPKGVLLVILIGVLGAMLMEYQKVKYRQV